VPAQPRRFSFTQPKMGSPVTIVFYLNDSSLATDLAKRSFYLVDSLVLIFSDYVDSSELSKLSASAGAGSSPVTLSPALLEILGLSQTAYEKSGGAFDITVGPLVKLWRNARKLQEFPADEAVQKLRKLVGSKYIILDTLKRTAQLTKAGMQLDLGGIAQGYIAQKVKDFLAGQHVKQVLVNVSGDVVTGEAPPGTTGWTIGINVPEEADELLPNNLLLTNRAVTTSGDAFQFMENGGKRYSHIIDPRSGFGVTYQRNVTVIARDGTTADWLATACSILSIKKAKKLAARNDAELLITEIKKGKVVYHATRGFRQYWKQIKQ
ncbi:MAG: FAD:protein FMN transferase, partial [Ferruginibacter sp.]